MSWLFTGQFLSSALQSEWAYKHQQAIGMWRHNGLPHHLSNITLPPTLLQPLGSKGEKGATAVPLLLPEQQLGGETQINATFPESSKETSTLQQLPCSLKAGSATWAPWAQDPGARLGVLLVWHSLLGHLSHPSSWGRICTGACPEEALLLLPTYLILDVKVQEGPGGQKDPASPLLQSLRWGKTPKPGAHSLKGLSTNTWERCLKLHMTKLVQYSSCTGIWQGHRSKQVCLIWNGPEFLYRSQDLQEL